MLHSQHAQGGGGLLSQAPADTFADTLYISFSRNAVLFRLTPPGLLLKSS